MFPLKTLPGAKNAPILTRLIIALNVLAFGAQWFLQIVGHVDAAGIYGVVPHCFTVPSGCGVTSIEGSKSLWISLFAAIFLHADILHLGFNMLFLSAFGGGLEDKLGKIRFCLIYFGGGFFASAAHILFHPFSDVPTIGASGAIAAVLGAYFITQPKSWVLTYLPPIFFFPVPAPLFLVIWIGGQIGGVVSNFHWIGASSGGGIAWMAHLGGFLAGALYGWKLSPWMKKKAPRKFN